MMNMNEGNGNDFGVFGIDAGSGAPGYDVPLNTALRRGEPIEMRPIPKELTDALRAEFLRLIEGDRFLDNLATLEGLARTTLQLTMTIGVTPKAANPPRRVHGNIWDGNVAYGSSSGPTGGKNPEQFGARAIRELVALVPEVAAKVTQAMRQSPASLVEAIASAKEKGLAALAEKLEAKLLDGIEDATSTPPAPPPPHGADGDHAGHAHANGANGAAAVSQ